MIEEHLAGRIRDALAAAEPGLAQAGESVAVELSRPRLKEHGDFATNVALAVARRVGKDPREVAEAIMRNLERDPDDLIAKVEVAGPGFINFHVAHAWLYRVLEQVIREGKRYGRIDDGGGERVQVEFVSINPTGPLHVGHGRNAAIGDSLANVLAATGRSVEREYYVNDTGRQMELFAASVEARYLQRFGREAEVPEEGYGGRAVVELAERIAARQGDRFLELPSAERRRALGQEAQRLTIEDIRATLDRFRVRFDVWFRESTLHPDGIARAIGRLREAGAAYDEDGAVWFRATAYGDDKDRVLIRANGEPTYFASDCAYLLVKFERGFQRLMYVWGADHHGAVKRLLGAAEALGFDPGRIEIILYQLVALYRDGVPVRMSKRTGELISLDELVDEVGVDAARYTFVSRSPDTPLDFDIEAVKRQTMENPVYYVQYAHARIAGIVRTAEERGIGVRPFDEASPEELVHEAELDLLRKIAELPEIVRFAGRERALHRLTRYAEELAAAFHRFYTECRVVGDDDDLTQARLWLALAAKRVLANVLALLGVQAPESMERLGDEAHA